MDAWSQFLTDVDSVQSDLGASDGGEVWFRGQEDASWPLLPSLHRMRGRDLQDLEADLFYEFSAKARELHGTGFDSWEILLVMRHHGVVTRLLDWSEQFAVALYFALGGCRELSAAARRHRCDPALWILNPLRLNELAEGWGSPYLVSPTNLFDRFKENVHAERRLTEYVDTLSERAEWPYEAPIAIYPRQVSTRQQAQSGWFTVHGKRPIPLEQLAPNAVRQIRIPQDAVIAGKAFLQRAGFNEYLLFPDLDGLARSLHDKYGVSAIPNPLEPQATD
jgi:hypothetical protein